MHPAVILLLAAAGGFVLWKKHRSEQNSAAELIRKAGIFVCLLAMTLRPVVRDSNSRAVLRNIDVLFAVDTTLSMWAQDYSGTQPRMDGVRNDVSRIMELLPGGSFGLIRFDNRSQILMPFTPDVRSVRDAVNIMLAPAAGYARGSSLAVPYEDMELLLKSSAGKEDKLTILFFISDGEETNNTELPDFGALKKYISGGAVLGYGTETGGLMNYENGREVTDPDTGRAAVSTIREDNLKEIAAQLGLDYVHMEKNSDADQTAEDILRACRKIVSEKSRESWRDIYWIFDAVLIGLLAWEVYERFRRGRL